MRRGMDIRAPSEADLPAALSHLLRLHESRWHARGEPGLLVDPRVAALLVDAVPDLATEGIVRLYTMTLDRRVAGAYLGFLVDRAAYAYFGGFDPAFSYEGPGTVLMGHAIEEATREGADTFHFLRGPEPYKYAWGATERCTWRRVLRRPAAALRPWQPPAQSIA
jgi:CelD/BcsL family acetyltransferase involved in cellulose biosynthesis